MLEEWLGIGLIVTGIMGFVLAQSPLVTELLGGTIGDNIAWAGQMLAILVALGVVLMSIRSMKLLALPLGLAVYVILYILLNWNAIFGGILG